MVDTQHFCLRWNNYQSSITSAFENLRDDEDFVDVTLACDGKSLKAHRVVLSACSPYFRELLKVSYYLILLFCHARSVPNSISDKLDFHAVIFNLWLISCKLEIIVMKLVYAVLFIFILIADNNSC